MSTHEATPQQPLLQAIDLKKHYPVKKKACSRRNVW